MRIIPKKDETQSLTVNLLSSILLISSSQPYNYINKSRQFNYVGCSALVIYCLSSLMCLSKEFEGSAPLQVRGHDPGSSDGSKVYGGV